MAKEIIIPFGADKPVRAIISPETQKICESLGTIEIRRASHVEPGSELGSTTLHGLWSEHGEKYVNFFDGPPGPCLKHEYRSKWWADCTPSNGPILGPFDDREEALAAESKWLTDNNIPVCRDCADNPQPLPAESELARRSLGSVTQHDLSIIDGETS